MNDLLRTALAAADAATAIHRRDRWRVMVEGADEKGRADYVSQTDLDAQRAASEVILARHPGHQVLGEEDGEPLAMRMAAWDGSPLWIVDPLDGTANFLHGHPQFAASVAVAMDGRPVAGAVSAAATGERWWAARGEGAFRNGTPIRVSRRDGISGALVGTGFPFKRLERLEEYQGQLGRVIRTASGVRRAGAAALDLCYLAQGSLDAFWELFLQPWDFAAGWLLVEEAGGVLVRLDGSPMTLTETGMMGANGDVLLGALAATLSDGTGGSS